MKLKCFAVKDHAGKVRYYSGYFKENILHAAKRDAKHGFIRECREVDDIKMPYKFTLEAIAI